jgi:hypothetical protein
MQPTSAQAEIHSQLVAERTRYRNLRRQYINLLLFKNEPDTLNKFRKVLKHLIVLEHWKSELLARQRNIYSHFRPYTLQFAQNVQALIYQHKNTFFYNFYQDSNRQISKILFLAIIQKFNLKNLQVFENTLQKKITNIENALQKYSWPQSISASLKYLMANNDYTLLSEPYINWVETVSDQTMDGVHGKLAHGGIPLIFAGTHYYCQSYFGLSTAFVKPVVEIILENLSAVISICEKLNGAINAEQIYSILPLIRNTLTFFINLGVFSLIAGASWQGILLFTTSDLLLKSIFKLTDSALNHFGIREASFPTFIIKTLACGATYNYLANYMLNYFTNILAQLFPDYKILFNNKLCSTKIKECKSTAIQVLQNKLHLQPNAATPEIKQAYYKYMLFAHTDKSKETSEELLLVTVAVDTLKRLETTKPKI